MTLTREFLESLNTIDEFCEVVPCFPEGIIERDFQMGWVNAMNMLDDGAIAKGDDAEFKRFALSEVRNFNEE